MNNIFTFILIWAAVCVSMALLFITIVLIGCKTFMRKLKPENKVFNDLK